MKEKIIEIIGSGMEPERAELKAIELMILFNEHIIEITKKQHEKFMQIIEDSFTKIQ